MHFHRHAIFWHQLQVFKASQKSRWARSRKAAKKAPRDVAATLLARHVDSVFSTAYKEGVKMASENYLGALL
jgi:hypothetical protein